MTNRKVLVSQYDLKDYKGMAGLVELLKIRHKRNRMFAKLIELVKEQKSFEEESMLYNYDGADKDQIWECMEFFYQNLWEKGLKEFIWSDDKDEWENYNILLKYKDKYSLVSIVYGIGSFCIIAPADEEYMKTHKAEIIDLENVHVKTTGEIILYV